MQFLLYGICICIASALHLHGICKCSCMASAMAITFALHLYTHWICIASASYLRCFCVASAIAVAFALLLNCICIGMWIVLHMQCSCIASARAVEFAFALYPQLQFTIVLVFNMMWCALHLQLQSPCMSICDCSCILLCIGFACALYLHCIRNAIAIAYTFAVHASSCDLLAQQTILETYLTFGSFGRSTADLH